MAKDGLVNNRVRHKLRELRLARKVGVQELARRVGIPCSSYACMEGGFYNISLDYLYRILGVLDADISEVWPIETAALQNAGNPLYVKKIQEFRLNEIVSLSQAEGAALFSLLGGKCSVLLHERLSDFLLDRVVLYLEDGRCYDQGVWFEKRKGATTFCFFLKAKNCPDYVGKLLEHYMVIWANVFGGVLPERRQC